MSDDELSAIITTITSSFGVSREDITSKSRDFDVNEARSAVVWVLRKLDMTFAAIAVLLSRNHTTVMHNYWKEERRLKYMKYSDLPAWVVTVSEVMLSNGILDPIVASHPKGREIKAYIKAELECSPTAIRQQPVSVRIEGLRVLASEPIVRGVAIRQYKERRKINPEALIRKHAEKFKFEWVA